MFYILSKRSLVIKEESWMHSVWKGWRLLWKLFACGVCEQANYPLHEASVQTQNF